MEIMVECECGSRIVIKDGKIIFSTKGAAVIDYFPNQEAKEEWAKEPREA